MKLLFQSSDLMCVGNQFATDVGKQPIKPVAEFFCINPLSDRDHAAALTGEPLNASQGRRADLNVSRFQNFLFEMDNTPLETQMAIISKLYDAGVPIATVTFSGSKSFHAIISLENALDAKPHTPEGVQKYKDTWKALAASLAQKAGEPVTIFDSSCQNPSRLSRTPGALRADKQQVQRLERLGRLCSTEELQELTNGFVPKKALHAKPVQEQPREEKDMMLMIPVVLMSKLKFPKTWATSTGAGNYHALFKNILWLIDSTGANQEMVTSFLEKYTFPYLLRTGYPREKCYKAINDAFNQKGKK